MASGVRPDPAGGAGRDAAARCARAGRPRGARASPARQDRLAAHVPHTARAARQAGLMHEHVRSTGASIKLW